jgi:hypothetical protein
MTQNKKTTLGTNYNMFRRRMKKNNNKEESLIEQESGKKDRSLVQGAGY